MNTIKIFCNYGVLAAEKRNIYTFGAPHESAVSSDEMTVAIPEGWEIYQNQMEQTMATAPWGWDYEINEVLQGNEYPYFRAYDKNMNMKVFKLEEA